MNWHWLIIILACVVLSNSCQKVASEVDENCEDYDEEQTYLFGFPEDSIDVIRGTIAPNMFLSSLLGDFGIPFQQVYKLSENAKDIFPVTQIRSGKPYTIVSTDTCFSPDYFIYQPNIYRYVKFDLRECEVEIVEKPMDTVRLTASGVITGSLWVTMLQQGISPALIDRMEDALAWSVDFYHIQNGDKFKAIYDQYLIDGKPAGVGPLYGAIFESGDKTFYSIHFKSDSYDGFFDEEGRPMKKAFLKSPVRYGRISSRYNLKRFHPVLKHTRPHLGTDYAAPTGTPILAVADGTVTHVAYTRGNGKYVKIKHDKMYSTQYLHMSKHANGLKAGHKVKQGQVIGYVGQTGLATGPHVCFRFWKNGRQVNHLRENLPPPEPMDPVQLPAYYEVRDVIKSELDGIAYPGKNAPKIVQPILEHDDPS
jgi:murein DD-endopeptidase MepM/ murein hydrolase activator NlpD